MKRLNVGGWKTAMLCNKCDTLTVIHHADTNGGNYDNSYVVVYKSKATEQRFYGDEPTDGPVSFSDFKSAILMLRKHL